MWRARWYEPDSGWRDSDITNFREVMGFRNRSFRSCSFLQPFKIFGVREERVFWRRCTDEFVDLLGKDFLEKDGREL